MEEAKILHKKGVFFDAFCGTGSVANYFKSYFDRIIINDNLTWCVTNAAGRINYKKCTFDLLRLNPFDYFLDNKSIEKGFFYRNYAPTSSSRMYFTPDNAGRIDFMRSTIKNWLLNNKISQDEYNYLMHCLIEAISRVSNTAGVYGAFLKKWDPRALKEINLVPLLDIDNECTSLLCYNDKIENIINDIDCDIIYIDPPYTQNQYGTQYHILETLILDDNPSISKITGSRPTGPMRSDWSKDYKAHILFDKIIAETKAKHIIFSYSIDGFMSKKYIESILVRYGKKESLISKEINYKKYSNHKSSGNKNHVEYLFYIEKKECSDIYFESPLNYIGSKAKYLSDIYKYIPKEIENFYDIFGGGFNVGVNSSAEKIVYNDINKYVVDLILSFKEIDTYDYITYVKKIIKKYNLTPEGKKEYHMLRDYYNSLPQDKKDPRILFSLIMYGFQQQIRFNSSHEYNNPCGMRWFNDKVLEKFISFARVIKAKDIKFHNVSFEELIDSPRQGSFFYMDPPYRFTLGSYNDGKRGFKGWDLSIESSLIDFCDHLNTKGCKFMLSYVLEHGGNFNKEIHDAILNKGYSFIELPLIPGKRRKEVIIFNYEKTHI